MTEAHWESVYLPEHPVILLARGWERQLDTRYAALFYQPTLTPVAYRVMVGSERGLLRGAARRAPGLLRRKEGRLIARGLPYLVEVWHSTHWRLFAVRSPTPLAQPPGRASWYGAGRAPRFFARRDVYCAGALHPLLGAATGTGIGTPRTGRLDRGRDAPSRRPPRWHRRVSSMATRPRRSVSCFSAILLTLGARPRWFVMSPGPITLTLDLTRAPGPRPERSPLAPLGVRSFSWLAGVSES